MVSVVGDKLVDESQVRLLEWVLMCEGRPILEAHNRLYTLQGKQSVNSDHCFCLWHLSLIVALLFHTNVS